MTKVMISKENANSVEIAINPKVYPIEVVYAASYAWIDKAYLLLDGDPKKEIMVKITPKENQGTPIASLKEKQLLKLGHEFANELLHFADYHTRSKETVKIREILLERAMLTNTIQNMDSKALFSELVKSGGKVNQTKNENQVE